MTHPIKNLEALDLIVESTVRKLGKRIVLATPLAGGKPNLLINAFYQRAKKDPHLQLTIMTALTLQKPKGQSLLERRFLEPMVERIFKCYPDLDYETDRIQKKTPPNIQIIEFYYPAGKFLKHPDAQQNYLSCNYTHVARDMKLRGVNVIAQMICREDSKNPNSRLSLSSNPDVSLDLIRELKKQDLPFVVLGQINQNMPFMYGDSLVDSQIFDSIVDIPEHYYDLFAPPKMSISDSDYLIGLYASSLVKDDGELQIGIGSLGDSVVSCLILRQEQNELYKKILQDLGLYEKFRGVFNIWGDDRTFFRGLFGATEMLVDGFMELYRHGILKKKVYDDISLQRLLTQGLLHEELPADKVSVLQILLKKNIISQSLTQKNLNWLKKWGFFKPTIQIEECNIKSSCTPNQGRLLKDSQNPTWSSSTYLGELETLKTIAQHAMGGSLTGGHLVHAGFFMGPRKFYDWLREMPADERALFSMRSIQKINQLYGHEELDRLHRKNARFINTCMITTLLGAHASETLANGQVISGVGGQYNFVAMAHELSDSRSMLTMRSTRHQNGKLHSNIVYNYGYTTIPRHLRDLLITEYGIADLRGKTDSEVIMELLKVADSRFQQELLNTAIYHGKLPADYQIPDIYRYNLPSNLQRVLKKYKDQGLFKPYPFGTDLTPEEQILGRTLKLLKSHLKGKKIILVKLLIQSLFVRPTEQERPYLERMGLWKSKSISENFYRGLLTLTLQRLHKSHLLSHS